MATTKRPGDDSLRRSGLAAQASKLDLTRSDRPQPLSTLFTPPTPTRSLDVLDAETPNFEPSPLSPESRVIKKAVPRLRPNAHLEEPLVSVVAQPTESELQFFHDSFITRLMDDIVIDPDVPSLQELCSYEGPSEVPSDPPHYIMTTQPYFPSAWPSSSQPDRPLPWNERDFPVYGLRPDPTPSSSLNLSSLDETDPDLMTLPSSKAEDPVLAPSDVWWGKEERPVPLILSLYPDMVETLGRMHVEANERGGKGNKARAGC